MIFTQKKYEHMQFFGAFLLNMLESDDSNLHSKFGVHIISRIFKLTKF